MTKTRKTRNVSPGRVGLAKGEFSRLILAAFHEPGTNRTAQEVATLLDANLKTVKSVKWSYDNPEKAKEFARKSNRKQAAKRLRALGRELKKLKTTTVEPVQLEMSLPEPVKNVPITVEQMRQDVAAIVDEVNDAIVTKHEEHSPVPTKPDMVSNPPHYTDGGIETIDFIRAKLTHDQYVGYLRGNILKYTSRLGKKDSMEQDAGKLAWYSQKLSKYLKEYA